MTIIHIHEFSTGILVDGTDDNGEWRSRGFSGEYMNSTLAKIPRPVQLAIKNREFAVSEGASSQNPALGSIFLVFIVTLCREATTSDFFPGIFQ